MDWKVTDFATLVVALGSLATALYQMWRLRSDSNTAKRQADGEATESEGQAAQALSEAAVSLLEPYKTISNELRSQNAQLSQALEAERARNQKAEDEARAIARKYVERNKELERQHRGDGDEVQRLRDENQNLQFQLAQAKSDLNDALRQVRAWELKVDEWRRTGALKTETGALRTPSEKK